MRHVWAARPAAAKPRDEPVGPKTMTYVQAVNEALRAELASRPQVLVYGEDVGKAGGIFAATRNLQREFGPERVFDTPIAESAILGSAVGAAIMGLKPIVEIMWADFLLVALDQLVNQAANVRYVTGGRCGAPLVVRTQQGPTPGSCAQHSQCLEALLAHIPGLRVALPATPQDAYDILREAVASDDPCVVIESRGLYQESGPVVTGGISAGMGKARLHGEPRDGLVVTWGAMLARALSAAAALRLEGLQVGVLDLRWLSPLDEDALERAARSAGGRVVVAHEANLTGGFGGEIVASLHERMAGEARLRVARLGAPNVRVPASPALQQAVSPDEESIARRLRELALA
jgi:2-oxoisovalerate dehydrogenase E1 component